MYAGRVAEIGPVRQIVIHRPAASLYRWADGLDPSMVADARAAGADRRRHAAADRHSRGCAFHPRCSAGLRALPRASGPISLPAGEPGARAGCTRARLSVDARCRHGMVDGRRSCWSSLIRSSRATSTSRPAGSTASIEREPRQILQGGRRRELRDRAGRNAWAGRRIGLRQIDRGAAHRRSLRADPRRHRVRRASTCDFSRTGDAAATHACR